MHRTSGCTGMRGRPASCRSRASPRGVPRTVGGPHRTLAHGSTRSKPGVAGLVSDSSTAGGTNSLHARRTQCPAQYESHGGPDMGNTKNAFGKPIFDDIYTFPQDSQDAVDFADEFANARRGTSAERQALPVGKQRDGMLWIESDTGAVWQSAGSGAWRVVVAPLVAYTPTVTGLVLSQVTVAAKFEQVGSR